MMGFQREYIGMIYEKPMVWLFLKASYWGCVLFFFNSKNVNWVWQYVDECTDLSWLTACQHRNECTENSLQVSSALCNIFWNYCSPTRTTLCFEHFRLWGLNVKKVDWLCNCRAKGGFEQCCNTGGGVDSLVDVISQTEMIKLSVVPASQLLPLLVLCCWIV